MRAVSDGRPDASGNEIGDEPEICRSRPIAYQLVPEQVF